MNPIVVLREEHEAIERELSELDFIMEGVGEGASFAQVASVYAGRRGGINYSNLVHTFWKICRFWDNHEKMEEEIFEVIREEGYAFPIENIFLDHESLRKRVREINSAVNSGSDLEVRRVLGKEMREFVDILRKHTAEEEEILIGIFPETFSEEGSKKIKEIIGKYR